ncbi:hypothetical protein PFISCL1PPCAC_8372, partial [Pristionchus fissidentatus]
CRGESGAGKTENTKKVIQYLAHVAGSTHSTAPAAVGTPKPSRRSTVHDSSGTRQVGQLEEQLLQANPILEAFGNSKTVKNDNSSRFGKFIRINFDCSGCISGANIEFYLLEKSRVLRQAAAERSFHVFYQLLAGASAKQRADLLLEDSAAAYPFMSNGKVTIGGVDDADEFASTLKAMQIMGFSDDEITAIYRVVSSCLLFGNLEFTSEKSGEQAILADDKVAQKICHLLGLTLVDLIKAFTKPKIKVGRDHVQRSQTEEQARFSVQAIAKASYERLFRWLVARINRSLDRTIQHGVSFVGILDIAGFEIFDLNSFEQLCINYTNEKLQQLFNKTMFIQEQEEYKAEGLDWKFIDFGLDLQPTIDLIEKPMGLFSLLDEECLFPKATDRSYVDKLNANHHEHPKYLTPEIRSKSDFAIVHYAGRVDYSAAAWRVKNMDPLNENVVQVLQASSDSLVVELWKNAEYAGIGTTEVSDAASAFGARAKKGMFRTVSQMHKEQLSRLMQTLNNTSPHFVRCIIPNHEKKPGKMDSTLVLEQLRCNGVLEGIRISRQGFPTRIFFQEFRQRYERLLAPNSVPAGFMDGKEAVKRILKFMEVDPNTYRIGLSKVFFRASVLAEIEMQRDQTLAALIVQFQALARGHLARRAFRKRVDQANAIRVLQRNGVAWMRLREWPWWKLLSRVRPLLVVNSREEEMMQREEELKKTTERLRRSEVHVTDVESRLNTMADERQRLQRQLEEESVERLEADEQRTRLEQRRIELEESLTTAQKLLAAEEKRATAAEADRKKLLETVHDLETQLEEEERARQKTQLEKLSSEQRAKKAEEDRSEVTDTVAKLTREKKSVEEKAAALSNRLIEEEERHKALQKLRHRLDASIQELQGELKTEKDMRAAMEQMKRQMEAELRQERDAATERLAKAEDLTAQLTRKEQENNEHLMKLEEEQAARVQLEKATRDLRKENADLEKELEKQELLRKKADKDRLDMSEELESFKQELEESQDKTAANQLLRAKREEEYANLQKQMEEQARRSEEEMDKLKQKMSRSNELLEDECTALKKEKMAIEKQRQSADSDLETLRQEIATAAAAKMEADRRRKAAEISLTDVQSKMADVRASLEDVQTKMTKITAERDGLLEAREAEGESSVALQKKIATLEAELEETRSGWEEEKRGKRLAVDRLRTAEEEKMMMEESREEAEQKADKMEKELTLARVQLTEIKKKLEVEVGEKMEDLRKKMQREVDAVNGRAAEAESARDKAEKAKRKALQECEDASTEISNLVAQIREAERRARKFDGVLAEKEAAAGKMTAERDAEAQKVREQESKNMQLTRDLEEMNGRLEENERQRKVLQLEVDNLASTKDDAGKSKFQLEQTNRKLEQELAENKELIMELEDAVQLAEDKCSRLEVNAQAARQELDRANAAREAEDEENKKTLVKKVRDMEAELEMERRSKATVVAAKKKLEMEVESLNQSTADARQKLEDATRQMNRAHKQAKEAASEGIEARAAMDEALQAARETEKKLRALESDLAAMQDQLSTAQASKRKAENEREEISEELDRIKKGGMMGSEEKRRLESKIAMLEEQLDDEQSNVEMAQERMRKTQGQMEQLTTDLAQERSVAERMETDRNTFERQLRELRTQLEETTNSTANRIRTAVNASELRISQMEANAAADEQEKTRLTRGMRRLETRLSEMNTQLEAERLETANQKEAVDRASAKARSVRRSLEEMEDSLQTERNKVRQLQRQVEELQEHSDTMQRENQQLKVRLNTDRRSTMMSGGSGHSSYVGPMRADRVGRFGSNASLRTLDDAGSVRDAGDRPGSALTSSHEAQSDDGSSK